jgi:hypothetical protein
MKTADAAKNQREKMTKSDNEDCLNRKECSGDQKVYVLILLADSVHKTQQADRFCGEEKIERNSMLVCGPRLTRQTSSLHDLGGGRPTAQPSF